MIKVSSSDTRAHLAELLHKVCNGERVLITKHNVPLAILSPAPSQPKKSVKDTMEALKKFREGNRLDGLKLKDLIEVGRR